MEENINQEQSNYVNRGLENADTPNGIPAQSSYANQDSGQPNCRSAKPLRKHPSTGIAGLLFVAIGSIAPGLIEKFSRSADPTATELVANVSRVPRNGGLLLLGISIVCIIAAIVSNIVYRKAQRS